MTVGPLPPSAAGATAASAALVGLMYELLDANDDTRRLSATADDESWSAHLEYLRALQRLAREALAHATVGIPA